MNNDNRIMGIDELAEYLNMSRSTLYKLSQEGKIPCQKIGRHWRYNREFIDEWMTQYRKVNMTDVASIDYIALAGASKAGSSEPNIPEGLELNRYFSVRQVRSLNNYSIHSVPDLLLSLATNQGKDDLSKILGMSVEKLDEIAVYMTKDIQFNRKGGST